jgi:hypothetical protein
MGTHALSLHVVRRSSPRRNGNAVCALVDACKCPDETCSGSDYATRYATDYADYSIHTTDYSIRTTDYSIHTTGYTAYSTNYANHTDTSVDTASSL